MDAVASLRHNNMKVNEQIFSNNNTDIISTSYHLPHQFDDAMKVKEQPALMEFTSEKDQHEKQKMSKSNKNDIAFSFGLAIAYDGIAIENGLANYLQKDALCTGSKRTRTDSRIPIIAKRIKGSDSECSKSKQQIGKFGEEDSSRLVHWIKRWSRNSSAKQFPSVGESHGRCEFKRKSGSIMAWRCPGI